MADDTKDRRNEDELLGDLPRRDFVGLSVAASLAAAGSLSAAGVGGCGNRRRYQDAGWHLRRRVHSPQERFPSGRADLDRCIRLAALDARHGQASCR